MVLTAPFLALTLATVPHGLVEIDRVLLANRSIRLADVMRRSGAGMPNPVIARIPQARDRITLSRAAIAALARRARPGLMVADVGEGTVQFVVRHSARQAAGGNCVDLNAAVAAGAVIDGTMVEPSACSDRHPAPLAFDRVASVPRATVALAAGTYLGPLSLRVGNGIGKGAATSLISTVGPVRIVRTVTALQASRGARVFVRDGDGQVFSVRRAELIK